MKQGSQEWIDARLGKATGSRVADVVAKTKNGWGASRANYASELIIERLTGMPVERYRSIAMENGTEREPEARDLYAFTRDTEVTEVGFIDHPKIRMAGASPDGHVGADGSIEIKCPMPATHLATLLGGGIDQKYQLQMQFQMATTGRRWCDFISYCPLFPDRMQMFVQRVKRDQETIDYLEREIVVFLNEIDAKIAALAKQYPALRIAA